MLRHLCENALVKAAVLRAVLAMNIEIADIPDKRSVSTSAIFSTRLGAGLSILGTNYHRLGCWGTSCGVGGEEEEWEDEGEDVEVEEVALNPAPTANRDDVVEGVQTSPRPRQTRPSSSAPESSNNISISNKDLVSRVVCSLCPFLNSHSLCVGFD